MNVLTIVMILSLGLSACLTRQPRSQDRQAEEDREAMSSIAELTFHNDRIVNSSCGAFEENIVLEFRGDDMRHPIFASLLQHSTRSSLGVAACPKPLQAGIRMDATLETGEKIVFVPADECQRQELPEGARLVPQNVLSDVKDVFAFHKVGSYSKNQIAVYGDKDRIWDADYESFEEIDYYARDKSKVFLLSKVVEGADRDSFETFGYQMWAKDKQHVYYAGKMVPDVDRATFALIKGSNYAVDAKSVYLRGEALPGISPVNFVCDSLYVCRNDTQILAYEFLMPDGVDLATFVFHGCQEAYSTPGSSLCSAPRRQPDKLICSAHDKNRTYTFERPVQL